jgi:hypothetical protein
MLDSLRESRFAGLILDYDGTCCTTEGRFDLPPQAVQEQLIRLMRSGLTLGFASGRGSSLWRDLRSWVPREYWRGVRLALYNGGVELALGDDLADQSKVGSDLLLAMQRLKRGQFGRLLEFEPRRVQVGVRGSGLAIPTLVRIASESLLQPPRLPLKVVISAHALDIVPEASSKSAILDSILERSRGGQVVAIGDQGQLGGNDFELLAATPYSLSVDRCSADPSRCWNLDTKGRKGPVVLVDYLRAFKTDRRKTTRFAWSHE